MAASEQEGLALINHGSFGGTSFTSFELNTSEPEAEMIRLGVDVVLKAAGKGFWSTTTVLLRRDGLLDDKGQVGARFLEQEQRGADQQGALQLLCYNLYMLVGVMQELKIEPAFGA